MSTHVTHAFGDMDDDVSSEALTALLDELDHVDAEHPDVSVTHETEWCLSAFADGLVVWENVEDRDGAPRHRRDVPRSEARRLFALLAAGRLDDVEAYGWNPGYG